MIDLGHVKPGRTLRIPFSSFDKDDGSSVTMTNYAVADILIYKDGSTTERASTNGFTATTDFDSKTGKHLCIIDLSDNTTADFFGSGGEYLVAIDAVTIDGVTTGGWIARFVIGYENAILNTTLATLSSQTSFTLANGPADDNALKGCWAIIHQAASAVQWSIVAITGYTGSTKTVTLAAGATFTAAAKDNFHVMGPMPLQPTTGAITPAGRTLVVDSAGLADANAVKVGPSGSGTAQTARDIGASVLLSPGTGTGQVDLTSGVAKANVTQLLGTAWLTPAVAGTPDVNAKQLGGTAQTGRDIGASVLLSAGTGTGQLDLTSGVVKSNLVQIIATALTETSSGYLAAAFKKLFDVASPVLTSASVNQTGDNYARLGAPAGASVSADVAAVKTDTGNLVTRITSTLFSGITSLKEWLGLLAGKQVGNSTARTELRSTGAGSGGFDETTDSQEAIRDRGDAAWVTGGGGSGGTTVVVTPTVGVTTPDTTATKITCKIGATNPKSVAVLDANGTPLDLTSFGTLRLCIETLRGTDVQVVEHAGITIGGTGNKVFTFTPDAATVSEERTLNWSLRRVSDNYVIIDGPLIVEFSALKDA